jgi:curved DNA-binding protein CbpA
MSERHPNRDAALDGLEKILDAGALEELFTGPEHEAAFLYDLLVDATRGRASSYYWEICRTARRRGLSPEFVIDRAAVLCATMTERRRTDLYRILGVPPLSTADTIRRRWLDIAKVHHPDVGGDGTTFRVAKQAYDVLSDAARRGEYERFWLRALGPFERVAPADHRAWPEPEPRAERAEPPGGGVEPAAVPAPSPGLGELAQALGRAARVLEAGAALDGRLDGVVAGPGVGGFLARVRATVACVQREELETLRAAALVAIDELEGSRRALAELAALRARLRLEASAASGAHGLGGPAASAAQP